MKAMGFATSQKEGWRDVAITLETPSMNAEPPYNRSAPSPLNYNNA